jgi:hypothetical protein
MEFARLVNLGYFRIRNSGIAAAKNVGIFTSTGSILVFFDDDDVADRHLLKEHLRTHQLNPQENVAVLGYTVWNPDLTVTPLMKYVTDIGQILFAYRDLRDSQTLGFTYFWGGRSSCKRSLLVNNGIFNQQFTFGSEDVELGYRLSKLGLSVIFNRKAKSYMNRSINYEEFCRRRERQGRSEYWFAQLHPDPVVQDYCQTPSASEKWRDAKPELEDKVQRVLDIEALLKGYDERYREGAMVQELRDLYQWTFDAFRIKGFVEAMHSQNKILEQLV